jgi:hypothetical protein
VINTAIGWNGASTLCDAVSQAGPAGPALSHRLYDFGDFTATTGSTDPVDYGLITEFGLSTHASAVSYGSGCYGVALATSARPVLGTTINLVTTGIPSGTLLATVMLSNVQHDPGLDLASIGMTGCRQYVDFDVMQIWLVTGPTGSVPHAIPNNPLLMGAPVYCQSATYSQGFNPLGVIASNGLTLLPGR